MRLWITRPAQDGEPLARDLLARGHESIVAPVMKVAFAPDPPALGAPSLLVAASRNAIRALVQHPGFEAVRNLPLAVVGPGTAAEASAQGFGHVIFGPGTGAKLAGEIAQYDAARLVDVCVVRGADMAFDIAAALSQRGIRARAVVLYRTEPADGLSEELRAAIGGGRLDGVLLFSPRTARFYLAQLTKAGLISAISGLRHYCLSHAVAQPLRERGIGLVDVSAKPNVKEMIELIG